MSHIVEIACEVKNLDALATAAAELGGELRQGQTKFRYYSGDEACSHAIHFPNATYEIGVIERGDGQGYTLKTDWYDGRLRAICGQEGSKLIDHYAAAEVEQYYNEQGFSVTKTTNERGELILEALK